MYMRVCTFEQEIMSNMLPAASHTKYIEKAFV